jgi:hypothetical protein
MRNGNSWWNGLTELLRICRQRLGSISERCEWPAVVKSSARELDLMDVLTGGRGGDCSAIDCQRKQHGLTIKVVSAAARAGLSAC